MSTRSIIVITGKAKYSGESTIRLYKHSDGYPTGNLPIILQALKQATDQVNAHNEIFKSSLSKQSINVEQLTGLVIGASTSVYGIGARIDDDYLNDSTKQAAYNQALNKTTAKQLLGNQSDLEWIYVIDLNKKDVSIYGGGYTGNVPSVAYKKGAVNPLKYIENLKSEYQDRESLQTIALIADIQSQGFTVNGSNDAMLKTKVKTKRVVKTKNNTITKQAGV